MFDNNRLLNYLEESSYLRIWLIYFTLTLMIILLVQLFLLPYIFSNWHAGDGLLVGGDWLAFHRTAVEMAEKIQVEGWSAWELWPKGWLPSGIASAIYALTWSQPWTMAPLNAAVHATTAILLLKILLVYTENRKTAIVATIPFIYFPSAMLWYTQIHRDGYYILGMLLFIHGLFLIIHYEKPIYKPGLKEAMGSLTLIIGVFLLWLSRPHTVIIFQYTGILMYLFIIVVFCFFAKKGIVRWKEAFLKLLVIALLLGAITPFTRSTGADKYFRDPDMFDESMNLESLNNNSKYNQSLLASSKGFYLSIESTTKHRGNLIIREEDFTWIRTPWLPKIVDNQLYSIAVIRSVYYPISYGETGSGIDTEVSFNRAVDFVYYLPRALQISFLAPFPGEWFGEGTSETTTFFRYISAFEMSFIYLMLISLIYGLWFWRKKIELYLTLFFCTVMMLPIVYSIPNVGTIYRYRYGFLMLLVSLGVVALCIFVDKIRQKQTVFIDTSNPHDLN